MSEKMENQLNLALETPEAVREQTMDLNVGFDAAERTWELIVKYNCSLTDLQTDGVVVEPLIAGYAILTVPEGLVNAVTANPGIEYVEKPKNFYYSVEGPSARACISSVLDREPFLSGSGVLLAVLDSGLAYRRREFRNQDGSTRVRFLWDQTLEQREGLPGPPEGFRGGVEFDRDRINEALRARTEAEGFALVPSLDVSGHGTAVAGIAAASPISGYRGVAAGTDLLIVKLGGGNGEAAGYSKTTQIMRAVTYALRKGQELGMPLVINLSFGNTYGPHNGSSLLERFLDNASEIGRTAICVASGNEGNASGHVQGQIDRRRVIELAIAGFERNLSVQLWKQFSDEYRITLRAPGGTLLYLNPGQGVSETGYSLEAENTRILVYYGQPTPYSTSQEIYLEMIPSAGRNYLASGIWQFRLEPVRVVTGQYYLYLPSAVTRNQGTGFLEPSPAVTLTIPSTAGKVITVGAMDTVSDSYADFSGRGYGSESEGERVGFGTIKPDVVAPGVNIAAPDPYGGFVTVSGTSFAAPIVSGSAALLMEWGILRGNDPYLYGEKVKAYFRAGALPLRGESAYPNERVGYGTACAAASLPKEIFQ